MLLYLSLKLIRVAITRPADARVVTPLVVRQIDTAAAAHAVLGLPLRAHRHPEAQAQRVQRQLVTLMPRPRRQPRPRRHRRQPRPLMLSAR